MTIEEALECNKNLRMYMKLSDKNQPYKFLEDNYIALDMANKSLEQTRWIPVSEELPKRNEWYSCTVDLSNFQLVTMDLYFKNGKWLDNRRIAMFNCYEIYGFGKSTEKHKLDYSELLEDFDWTERVVAWMPLPSPFEPQESEG